MDKLDPALSAADFGFTLPTKEPELK